MSRKPVSYLGGLDFPARYLFLPVVAVCFMSCNLCLALRHQQKKNNPVLHQQLVGNKHISNTPLFHVRWRGKTYSTAVRTSLTNASAFFHVPKVFIQSETGNIAE